MIMKQTIITILLALLIIPMGVEAKKKGKKDEVPQLISYPSAELDEYRLHGGEPDVRGARRHGELKALLQAATIPLLRR